MLIPRVPFVPRSRSEKGRPRSLCTAICLAAFVVSLVGCATRQPDLGALDREIEIDRFMGDWYVLAFIPIDLFFFSEADAHDAVESYRLNLEGEIDVTYTFFDGDSADEPEVVRQRARVFDEVRGTEWRLQILGPFESAYLIAWLDEDYELAIIGVPSRSNVWVLSRSPHVTESAMLDLTKRVTELGYDSSLLKRVPQRALQSPSG